MKKEKEDEEEEEEGRGGGSEEFLVGGDAVFKVNKRTVGKRIKISEAKASWRPFFFFPLWSEE